MAKPVYEEGAVDQFASFIAAQRKFGNKPQKTAGDIRSDIAEKFDKWETIVDANTGKKMSADDELTCKKLDREIAALQAELATVSDQRWEKVEAAINGSPTSASKPQVWHDATTGKPVYCLGKSDRLQDLPTANRHGLDEGDSIGAIVNAMVTGRRDRLSGGLRNALSEGTDSLGGITVPEEIGSKVIDLARAKSAVMAAGCAVVPMSTDRLVLARISADPTFAAKAENVALSEGSITFDAIGFTATTIGALIVCSRELVEDSPNFSSLVETTLANAFAAKIDNAMFNGIYHFDGFLNWATASGSIGETAAVGTIAWTHVATATTAVHAANFTPTAYITHPTVAGALSVLAAGDGTNSSKNWLGPPPNVAPLLALQTTNCPNTSLVVGDFKEAVLAVRQSLKIEATNSGGDNTFGKHQIAIKATFRGDFNAFHRAAFYRLVGIS